MSDKPIIFSAPMIRALLEGRKTQTRRILKPQPFPVGGQFYRPFPRTDPRQWHSVSAAGLTVNIQTVPYAPGDRLWVREAHYLTDDGDEAYAVFAEDQDGVSAHLAEMQTLMASYPDNDWSSHLRLRPSIHMPRWASRLTLIVTDVRVQRLQEITAADTIAEGVQCRTCEATNQSACSGLGCFASMDAFAALWNSIHGPGAWDANPWVCVISFTVQHGNIDKIGGAA